MDRLRNVRFTRAVKFDYCVLSSAELRAMVDAVRRQDALDPGVTRPLVAIGHTKDLTDIDTVKQLLAYLDEHAIPVSGFEALCAGAGPGPSLEIDAT